MKLNLDGWTNFLSKVGFKNRDKRTAWQVESPPQLLEPDLSALYHGNDVAQRICRGPAQEMTRAGFELNIPGGDVAAVEQALDTMRLLTKLTEALTWARLFGGSVLFVGADDGQDPEMPLNLDNIRSIRFLTVLDRHDLHIRKFYDDPLEANFSEPEIYEVIRARGDSITSSNRVPSGRPIHETRLIRFDGTLTGRRQRRDNDGWADSIFIRLFGVLRGYGATWTTVEALMNDFAQAVIRVKGLADAMSTHGEDVIMKRMELMDTSRGVLRALLLDADNEEFERKPTPMGGVPEILNAWMSRMASAAEMPITLLFGTSPGGMNATGESDERNWFNVVSAMQENNLRPQLERFLTILFNTQDGPTGGVEPAEWSFEFKPLRQNTMAEDAAIRKVAAETDAIYMDRQVLSPDEVANSRFGGDSFTLDTELNNEARALLADFDPAPVPAQGDQDETDDAESTDSGDA